MKDKLAAIAEILAALSLTAWVGGHAALGAFAARIIFRDLPREMAAPTMTTVFRSFDSLLAVCLVILALSVLVRALAFHRASIDRFAALVGILLIAIGVYEITSIHPAIEEMFRAGRTLEPAFARLHKLSERCGHLEVIFTALLFSAHAWSRKRTE